MLNAPPDPLVMADVAPSRNTIWRHYLRWRKANGLSIRCDNPECIFHKAELKWNEKTLKPILDHKSGNSFDNRPENLRLLCPNCDSQNFETRGGANAGRISRLSGGAYTAKNRNGTADVFAIAASLGSIVTFGTPTAHQVDAENQPVKSPAERGDA